MTAQTCPSCHEASRDGHLCHPCTRRLTYDLGEVPWLWLETERAAVGLSRLFTNVGGRSTTTALPVNLAASETARKVLGGVGVRNGIVGWVRITADDLGAPWPANTVTAMCDHLAGQAPGLRKHEAVAELVGDVHDWTEAMVQAINRPTIRRIPVGPCPLIHDGTPCEGRIWATFPDEQGPYSACDRCVDPDAGVGVWESTQWAALGRLIQARKAEVARQRTLAESLTRGAGRAS